MPSSSVVELGSDDLDLAVVDLGRVERADELERRGPLSASLGERVLLADALALERRTVRDGDRQLGDLDLQAADLDGLLDELVAGDVGDDVLVGAHAGGEDLRDVGGRDGREAVADRAGRRRVPLVGDLAQREHEREDAVLVVRRMRS